MESKCVVCHEKAAQHRCVQCHKPVCDDCAFKTELGVFCGRECAAKNREYKQHAGPTARKKSGLSKIIIVVIILIAAYFVAKQMGFIDKARDSLPIPGNEQPGNQ